MEFPSEEGKHNKRSHMSEERHSSIGSGPMHSVFIPNYRIQDNNRNAFWNYRFDRKLEAENHGLNHLLDQFDTELTFSGKRA